MSVRFYDKKEHPSGFVGFRVSRTIYGEQKMRQRYFSLRDYSYADAFQAAHKLKEEWDLESELAKEKHRLNAQVPSAGQLSKKLETLADIADLASEAGIKSTQQLSVFLMCASQENNGIYEIFGYSADSPEYKRLYASVRQLMLGTPARSNNGANVLAWGENIVGKEKAVTLTTKGYRLLKTIESMLD